MQKTPLSSAISFLTVLSLASLPMAGCGEDRVVQDAPRSQAASEPAKPSPSAAPRQFTVLGAGDVLVHPPVWQQAERDRRRTGAGSGKYDFFPMFEHVSGTISSADLALCHLEVPIAEAGQEPSGFPYFNAPPEVLDGIRAAGFDGCSTASNHVIDKGLAGVTRTLNALDRAGLGHAGSARSAAEAATPRVYDVRGVKVAHLSYTLNFNGLHRPAGKEWLANLIDPAKIRQEARRARKAGAEVVILSAHWGTEYQHLPNSDQLSWAGQLAGSPDIDLILGHHAHVVQPFEKVKGKWVAYGMGNELARHAEPINVNREGVMARMTFTETARGRWRVTVAEAIATWTDISPDVRLVELPKALGDPALAPDKRRTYQAAWDRIAGYLRLRGADRQGLVIVGAGRPEPTDARSLCRSRPWRLWVSAC